MNKSKKLLSLFLAVTLLLTSLRVVIGAKTTNSIGDINCDGKVSAADARLALRASVGLENLTEAQFKSADVNKDNKVTASDARTILRVSVGLEKFDIDNENMISVDEIKKMEIVSNTISEYMKSEEYTNLDSNEEKVEYITNLLTDLSNQGLIQKNSIQYSEIDNSFIYKHINGVRSFIWLNPSNNMEVSLSNYSYSYEHNENELINNIFSSSSKITNSVDTVFMYGFDKINDKYSIFEKYDSLMREYSKQGLLTTIYSNPTVFDYKTAFTDAKYINIIEHGGFDTNLNISYFSIAGDQPNENTLLAYNTDIYFERIFTGTDENGEDTFIITPKFFEFYYSNNKLDGSVVFLFCCQGFGANGNVNYEFAKAFEKCGADTIIGFHNSVFEEYASSIYMEFTESMLYGYTTNDSLNSAVELYGKNDIEYGSAFFPLSEYWNKVDPSINKTWQQSLKEHTIAAYPIIYGEKNKKFDIKLSSVTGTVTDSKTDRPISNVTVEVIDNKIDSFDPVVTTTTDANGKYEIELPYGSYSISFNHENYEYYGTSFSVNYEDYEENATLSPKKTCITSCEIVDYGRYTENLGDSCVFHLDKSGLPGATNSYYRNGNIGIDGTEYNNGLEVWIARWNPVPEISWAYATYKLNGNFQKLSGKTGIINSYNTTNFDTTVYFYNGDTLLQKVDLTNSDYAKSFSIDVSDVKELKILVKDNIAVAGGTSFALYDMFLS